MFSLKSKPIIVLSALIFTFGLMSFTVSNATSSILMDEPCKHCGSVEACEEGGQEYGVFHCEIVEEEWGTPEGCNTEPIVYCSLTGPID